MAGDAAAIEVAVFSPIRKTFHYCKDVAGDGEPVTGRLVRVPFGGGQRIGVVLGSVISTAPSPYRLKPVAEVFNDLPVVSDEVMQLARWAADYYQHPLGDALATTLPGALRRGRAPPAYRVVEWFTSDPTNLDLSALSRRAPRQALVLERIVARPAIATDFADLDFDWRRALGALEKKGWVQRRERKRCDQHGLDSDPIALNQQQQSAASQVVTKFGSFNAFLLHGITGSGKTEVYLDVIRHALTAQTTALLLVPEISLTQQMVARLQRAFGSMVGVLHSGLSDTERAQVWLRCRAGEISVLMGTRSAVWAPLQHLGIIVVDEEHDISFKQQEGFRYNARDVAIKRAQLQSIPIVLGTATPSLETYLNAKTNKYGYLSLPNRAGAAREPAISCIDVRGLRLHGGLSEQLCRALRTRIERGEQSILFLNRRGFAPVILCHQCGHVARCARCDANLVWHKERAVLICHHCGSQTHTARIAACCREPDLVPVGLGTEQVAEALGEMLPEANIARIDRDTMRRKNAMNETFAAVRDGTTDVLIGTQMLAKGHDFSRVSLVGIIDADSQLFSTDFRAEEKLAQMIVQVAGRAGRAEIPGEVLIQTHHPHHPLLGTLINSGYEAFAERALGERSQASLPPYVPVALIRAESLNQQNSMRFLAELAQSVRGARIAELDILGPIPAVMEKRAGRYRAQLMLSANVRRVLALSVKKLIGYAEQLPSRKNVRWSIDIDPQESL